MKLFAPHTWISTLLLTGIAIVLASPVSARDKFKGEAELKYVDVSSRPREAGYVYEAESFSQRYALSYSIDSTDKKRGPLEYNFNVGYEWLALDTSIRERGETGTSDSEHSFRNGRLYYEGEVAYDPNNLPLAITGYARDMQRTVVNTTSSQTGATIISTQLPVNLLTTGTHMQYGTTLILGEKHGLNNRYGKLFSHIPMLYVDYSEKIDRDDRGGDSNVNTRTRKLAFVSLNKKDNWFHYRTEQHMDYLNSFNDWQRTEYQLGTIDQRMSRHWVQLTNWISISADAQFSKMQANNSISGFEEYNLNLFATAARKSWQMRTFSTFNRRNENGVISAERSIPINLTGVYGADTDWSTSVFIKDRQFDNFTNSEEIRRISLRATTFKRSQFRLSPMFSVQQNSSLNSKTLDLLGGFDLVSTRRFSAVHDISLSYNAEMHLVNSPYATDPEYLKQSLNARWTYTMTDRIRLSLQQQAYLSSALNDANTAEVGAYGSADFVRSVTTGSASWVPNSHFTSSLMATNEMTRYADAGTESRQIVRLNMDHKSEALRADLGAGLDRNSAISGKSTMSLDLFSAVEYTPVRNFSSSLRARYKSDYIDGLETGATFDVNLRTQYDIYPAAFTGRPIVQLEKEFSYTQGTGGADNSWVRMMVRYNPYSRISLHGSANINIIGAAQQVYALGADLNLKYFQSSVDYTYGRRSSDQRIDRRFAASVRRTF